MRVNDLMGTNMTILQDQRQKEEKLRESEKLLEVCVILSRLGNVCMRAFRD